MLQPYTSYVKLYTNHLFNVWNFFVVFVCLYIYILHSYSMNFTSLFTYFVQLWIHNSHPFAVNGSVPDYSLINAFCSTQRHVQMHVFSFTLHLLLRLFHFIPILKKFFQKISSISNECSAFTASAAAYVAVAQRCGYENGNIQNVHLHQFSVSSNSNLQLKICTHNSKQLFARTSK